MKKGKKPDVAKTDKRYNSGKFLSAEKRRFRAIEIYCWIQKKAGLTYDQVAEKAGISPRTAFRHIEKIQNILSGMLDVEDYRQVAFYGNILQALDNLGYFLAKRKEKPTLEFLKGVGILREYVHSEGTEKGLTRDELRKDIRELSELIGTSGQITTAPRNRVSESLDSKASSPEHK